MKKNWKEILKLWLSALLLLAESAAIGCKKLPKKAVALCVAAALVVAMVPVAVFAAETTYDIWVGGVQVTSDNLVIDINDNAAISGSATYDPATSTLTLDDFSYTGAGYVNGKKLVDGVVAAAIYSADDLNILLEGDSVITHVNSAYNGVSCGIASMKDLTIADAPADGIGTLTVTSGADCNVSAGIYAYDNVTITGGIINATGDVASYTSTGILANWNNIIISGGEVTAVGKNSNEYSTGLIALWNITISDATVNATAGDAYDAYSIRAGICAYGGKVAISNSKVEATTSDEFGDGICANDGLTIIGGTVTASGDYGIYTAGALTIEGGTVTAKGSEAGIYVENNITIDSGTVKATASGDYGIGIVAYAVTVNGGTVEAISTGEYGYGMTFYDAPTLNGTLAVYAGEDASAGKVDVPTKDTYANKYVKIEPVCTVTVNYGIDGVDNKEITVTKGDTISLENPVIDGYIFMGWYADENFTTAFDFDTPITVATTVYAKFADYEGDKTELNNKIDAAKAELQGKIDAVNSALAGKADAATVNAAIANLQAAIAALEAVKDDYATADTALKTELEGKIADAQTAAISAAETLVNNAKTELQSKIDEKANTADVNAAIAELQAAIVALEAVKDDYATADATLKTELEGKIATAKSEAISAAETLVNNAKTELQSKIDAKADAATTTVAIQNLQAAVAALEAVKDDYATADATLKTELEGKIADAQTAAISAAETLVNNAKTELQSKIDAKADTALKTELEGKISAAQTATISAAETLVNNAKTELQSKIDAKADAATTTVAIQNLQAAVAALEAVKDDYATADATLKTELEGKISAAQTATISAAETLVNNAKAELTAAINNKADTATLNAKINELNTAIATAEATAKAYTDNAAATLTTAIATAKSEAISAAETLVNTAKAELQSAIDTKADAATVNVAIANLQNAITALENAKDNYVSADAALKAELEAAIAKAKQEAIDAAKGHIPYIGTNGNWWIGDTDTGVDANGIKGDTGNGIASITTKKENGVTTVTITFTDPQKEPVVFTISDGATGATGADGVGVAKVEKTATNGKVDTYTITLTNGTTYTFTVTNGKDGANGMDGENGKDGADGKDGLTPFIGENGNWWIGETDTGVKAAADDSIPVGSGNVTEAEGVNTVTVVAIVIASLALLGNVLLAVLVLKKKKSLV